MIDGVELSRSVDGAYGVVVARGVHIEDASEALWAEIRAATTREPPDRQGAVRDLLRHGKYKPTGRGKPASEYLLRAAREGSFPRINNLVDALNLVSLDAALPISLIDLERAGAASFEIRRGRAGESYVFNSGGQVIDLEDLLLVAAGGAPCANPVKDSMATKLVPESRDVLAVLYAPANLAAPVEEATRRLAALFGEHGRPSRPPAFTVLSSV